MTSPCCRAELIDHTPLGSLYLKWVCSVCGKTISMMMLRVPDSWKRNGQLGMEWL